MPPGLDVTEPYGLGDAHLLLVDAELEASDVLALIGSRVPRLGPMEELDVIGGADLSEARSWRLSRNSRLTGPIVLSDEDRAGLGLPADAHAAFALRCPRDREPAPPPQWYADTDGLHEVFPAGLPNREEGRMLDLLIAVAKRLHLRVRIADDPGRAGTVLAPDPGLTVDHYVYSPYWLAPDVLLEQLRAVEPAAALPHADLPPVTEGLAGSGTPEDPVPLILDGYAVAVDLTDLAPEAGTIEVRVMQAEVLPEAVRQAAAEGQEFVEYHVHWMDADQRRFQAHPAEEFAALRDAAAARVEALTRTILLATAGLAVDEGGFLVTAGQLEG
jgi:hypothetical protein